MATTKQRRLSLPERAHKEGCPGERIERFAATRPPKADRNTGIVMKPAQTMTVVRCIDCGGEVVYDKEGNRAAYD